MEYWQLRGISKETKDNLDVYLENTKDSDFGTIDERRDWFIDRLALDAKRYEVAELISDENFFSRSYEDIEERIRILERDANSTAEFNKMKQKIRKLVCEIGIFEKDSYNANQVNEIAKILNIET